MDHLPISIILTYVIKIITLSNVVEVLVGGHYLLKSYKQKMFNEYYVII